MKKLPVVALVAALMLALVLVLTIRRAGPGSGEAPRASPPAMPAPATAKSVTPDTRDSIRAVRSSMAAAPPLSTADKSARIAKITRDYEEIRNKVSADYAAAGASFPGGLNAFLRQLALLEREKRADIAAFITPAELEEVERAETSAGHLVEHLLGPTSATEEQRRRVFRLQLDYDDRFALTFDISPSALLERERARQQVQEQIHWVLGDELFGSWLLGESENHALLVAFASRFNLPFTAALELRTVKNDYTLQRLELNATKGMAPGQMRAAEQAAAQQAEARIISIVGPGALQAGRADVLSWLPKR